MSEVERKQLDRLIAAVRHLLYESGADDDEVDADIQALLAGEPIRWLDSEQD